MPVESALNYPYIRVRDVEWLKRTLLLFPSVLRMTPLQNAPADDPAILPFTQCPDPEMPPLLASADLWAAHVKTAQHQLIADLDKLFTDSSPRGRRLLSRFRLRNFAHADRGEAAIAPTVWERRLAPDGSFQIHSEKMLPDLAQYLRRMGLAWNPGEWYSDGPLYLEMNPRLGEAVMATLAYACAENEGLQVVTEFPKLHGRLLGVPRAAIIDACFGSGEGAGGTSGQQIGEFLVHRRCDVSELTTERLYALKQERDALAEFRKQLELVARDKLPPLIYDQRKLQQCLDDEVSRILKTWQEDKRNLSNYARRLFGEGVLDEPIKAIGKVIQDSLSAEGAALVAGGTVLHAAAGASIGFAIAFVVRAVRTWNETKAAAKHSPYRYLTSLEKQGVSFSMTNVLNPSHA